jgi:hypothetical protein
MIRAGLYCKEDFVQIVCSTVGVMDSDSHMITTGRTSRCRSSQVVMQSLDLFLDWISRSHNFDPHLANIAQKSRVSCLFSVNETVSTFRSSRSFHISEAIETVFAKNKKKLKRNNDDFESDSAIGSGNPCCCDANHRRC